MKSKTKKYYLKTNTNFTQLNLNLNKPLLKNFSKFQLDIQENQLPLLKSFNYKNASSEKMLIPKKKLKKTKFLKSQEKLKILIQEEENFKNYYLNLIRNKIKDEEKDFNNFLLNTRNDIPDNELFRNTFLSKTQEKEKIQKKIEKEEKRVFPSKRNLGKNETDCNDYIKRFNRLFPQEILEDADEFQTKTKNAVKIQQFFRGHKKKIKLYTGYEEPDYFIRIYEHEYDINSMIKSIEIKIYSKLFEKNVTVFKTIEELFGVEAISKEKIVKKIDEIIGKILGFKKVKRKVENKDYYDPEKADLSSDDFNDFEEDDD